MRYDREPVIHNLMRGGLAPAQQGHVSCRGGNALLQHAFAQKRVDQGAFAGIELTGSNNEKKLIQLVDSFT